MLNEIKKHSWDSIKSGENINALIKCFIIIAVSYIVIKFILEQNKVSIGLLMIVVTGLCFFIPTTIQLYTLTITIYCSDWLSDSLGFIPREFTWFSDLIIVVIFLKTILLTNPNKKTIKDFPYLWLLLGSIFLMISSLIYNGENIMIMLPGLKIYLKYIILAFSLFLLDIGPSVYRKMFKLLTVIMFIQVVASLVQFFYVGNIGDYGGGTLGKNTTGLLCVFGGIFTCIFLEKYFLTRRLKYLFYNLLLFIPAFAGEAKFAFFLYPLIYLYYFLIHSKNIKKFVLNTFFVILFIPIFIGIMTIYDKHSKGYLIKWFKNPTGAYEYEQRISKGHIKGAGRLGTLNQSIELGTKDIGHFFLGYGPCSTVESFLGSSFESHLYRTGMFEADLPFFQKLFIEIGFWGVVLYLSLIAVLLMKSKKAFVNHNLLISMLVVFFLSSFYVDTFSSDVLGFMFWFLVSALHVKNNKGEKVIKSE